MTVRSFLAHAALVAGAIGMLQTPAAAQQSAVDGGQNGGITVTAWDGDRVLIGARIQSSAPSAEEAKDIASHIQIVTDGGRIRATTTNGGVIVRRG